MKVSFVLLFCCFGACAGFLGLHILREFRGEDGGLLRDVSESRIWYLGGQVYLVIPGFSSSGVIGVVHRTFLSLILFGILWWLFMKVRAG